MPSNDNDKTFIAAFLDMLNPTGFSTLEEYTLWHVNCMFLKPQLKHLFVIGTVRIMRNKGELRNYHVQERLKETGLRNVVWTPGENPRTGKKKTLGKTEEIQIKYNLTLMIIMH